MRGRAIRADTRFIGAVGDDDMADEALASVAGEGIDVSRCLRLPGVPTAVALIMVDLTGENQIAVASGANGALDGPSVTRALDGLEPPPGSVMLLAFEVSDEVVIAAATWAAARGMAIIVDPGPARPLSAELLALHPILKPNQTEALQLTGEHTVHDAANALTARTGAPVVVTLGAGGALLLDPGMVKASRASSTSCRPPRWRHWTRPGPATRSEASWRPVSHPGHRCGRPCRGRSRVRRCRPWARERAGHCRRNPRSDSSWAW